MEGQLAQATAPPQQPEGQAVQYAIPAGYQAVAVPAMDPAQYTAWLQALQAQQVVAQQMYMQQIAGASGAAGLFLVCKEHRPWGYRDWDLCGLC